MQLINLINYLEETVPLSLQEDYDNCGLILGDPDQEINKGLVCLDITEEILQEAIDSEINLILSHHPLIFKGIRKINPQWQSQRILEIAIRHQIAIYSLHTNLDKIYGGVSFQFGKRLGLEFMNFLSPYFKLLPPNLVENYVEGDLDKNYQGLGIIGYLPKALSWTEFLNHLRSKIPLNMVRHTRIQDKLIQKIALCGGSGSEFLEKALEEKCDVYISGDFKYHQFFLEKPGTILVDIGHFETEQFSPELIRNIISKKFPTFALSLTKLNSNPIYYSY